MFTPRSPATLVSSARTPSRSDTGTRTSTSRSGRAPRAGKWRRARLARSSTSRTPWRSAPRTRSRISRRSSITLSRDEAIASALSAHTSGQIPGWPAATRVMSRNPPAASRRRTASCAAPSDAAFMSVAATRCGTWETTATSRSWSAGLRATTSAPSDETTPRTREKASRSVSGVGVRTHNALVKRSGSAPSSPTCSEPAMGWPPTNRGCPTAWTTASFTPLTSVTTRSGRRAWAPRSAPATPATAEEGVATKTSSASRSSPSSSRAPSSSAARVRAGSVSNPWTRQPRARSARPIDPPMSPVPTTSARPGSDGEVIAKDLGAVEVDVAEVGRRPVGVDVQEHADAPGHGAEDRDLGGAEEGHRTEADAPCRRRGEHRDHVGRRREDHADHVVEAEAVARHQLGEELLDALGDLLFGVLYDGGGATKRAHGPRHAAECYLGGLFLPEGPSSPARPAGAGSSAPDDAGRFSGSWLFALSA